MQTVILHRLQITWQISVIDAAVSSTLMIFACVVTVILNRYYQPKNENNINRLGYVIVLSVLYCLILKWLLTTIFQGDTTYLAFVDKSIPIRFIFCFILISVLLILNWFWSVLTDQKENEKRKSDTENLLKEAELAKLRQQLQPHFLFNSLNSISALIVSKPAEARKMTQQLSDFLRGTLKKEDKLVQLSEELEHLKLYLDIEKVRFGHRLNVVFSTDEESVKRFLPALLLQPIVENAIKFGLYDVIGNVTISITTTVKDGNLVVEVQNPFDIETNKNNQGAGFGLSSIQRRLYLLYARNDLLLTEKKETIFITSLKIPEIK